MRIASSSASDAPKLRKAQLNDFSRRIIIREVVAESQTVLPKIGSSDDRFWIPSHFEALQPELFMKCKSLNLITFEILSRLQRIERRDS
jgi:hypothetical protein